MSQNLREITNVNRIMHTLYSFNEAGLRRKVYLGFWEAI